MFDEEEARAALEQTPFDKLDDLIAAFARQARAPSRGAIAALDDGSPNASLAARMVLGDAEDLAIKPLLGARLSAPQVRAWAIRSVSMTMSKLRTDVARWAGNLLADKTPVPSPPDPLGEREPTPFRVCDEAFLAVRRLIFVDVDEERRIADEDAFGRMSNAQRDGRIAELVRTSAYRRAVGEREG
jgi:hypothetical protein